MVIAQSLAAFSLAARTARHNPRRTAPSRVVVAAAAAAPGGVRPGDPAGLRGDAAERAGWYTNPEFLRLEHDRVFLRRCAGWQAVGHIGQVKNPNDAFMLL